MKEALFWDSSDDGSVICGVCAHRCRIPPGKRGLCAVRENNGGTLYSSVYGRAVAEHVDPIEKKPLYHFLPSSATFSIATVGCNFKCDFCQNWSISQALGVRSADADRQGSTLPPEGVVELALKHKCRSVSFTYTEPTVFFEYALDTMRIAKGKGLKTVLVSNGYMTRGCLAVAGPFLDACNIDLKSFRDDFYRKHCGASLAPVLESLKALVAMGVWLEVTTLLIDGENDSDAELAELAGFIAGELGRDTPWHVSRFFPQYRMTGHPATGVASMERAMRVGKDAGLRYVYAGNAGIAQETACPQCGEVLIRRHGYATEVSGLDVGSGFGCCRKCGAKISGVFC